MFPVTSLLGSLRQAGSACARKEITRLVRLPFPFFLLFLLLPPLSCSRCRGVARWVRSNFQSGGHCFHRSLCRVRRRFVCFFLSQLRLGRCRRSGGAGRLFTGARRGVRHNVAGRGAVRRVLVDGPGGKLRVCAECRGTALLSVGSSKAGSVCVKLRMDQHCRTILRPLAISSLVSSFRVPFSSAFFFPLSSQVSQL